MHLSDLVFKRTLAPEGRDKSLVFESVLDIGPTPVEEIGEHSNRQNHECDEEISREPEQERLVQLKVDDADIDYHAENQFKEDHVGESDAEVGPPGLPSYQLLLLVFFDTARDKH